MHYFRGEDRKWKTITDSEFEVRQTELPSISFATRYAIDWSRKDEKSGKHHLDDVMDQLASLEAGPEECKESAVELAGENMPIYYAFT